MNWSEHIIANAIARQTLSSKCLVLVDNCAWTGHECDVLGVTMDRRLIDVEVKISRADLKADAKKMKWWHCARGVDPKTGRWGVMSQSHREHPPKVWKHYYAMPAEIWDDALLDDLGSSSSGVLLLTEGRHGRVNIACRRRVKPAKDAYRLSAEEVLNVARLANLRMWDAYMARDRVIAENRRLREEAA